jgi:hypothetical protein
MQNKTKKKKQWFIADVRKIFRMRFTIVKGRVEDFIYFLLSYRELLKTNMCYTYLELTI